MLSAAKHLLPPDVDEQILRRCAPQNGSAQRFLNNLLIDTHRILG